MTHPNDVVEAVAKAICEADCGCITENELARCRELAIAALSLIKGEGGLDHRQIAVRYMDALARQLAKEGKLEQTEILHKASNLLDPPSEVGR
jgi:uncharacterized protein YaaW (UPF0174 family)